MIFTGGFWYFEDSVPHEELGAQGRAAGLTYREQTKAGPPPSLLPQRPLPMMRLQIDTGCLRGLIRRRWINPFRDASSSP